MPALTATLNTFLLLASPCAGHPGLAASEAESQSGVKRLDETWRERLWLSPESAGDTPDPSLVEARYAAFCRLHVESKATPPDARHEALPEAVTPDRALLARFVDADRDLWSDLGRRLADWWEALGSRLFTRSGKERANALLGWILLAVALVTLGALFVLAQRRWRQGQRPGREPVREHTSEPALEPATVHLSRAGALLFDQPRASIRESWLAVLSTLEEHRLASPRRVHTNQEIAGQLPRRGASSALSASFSALAERYDATFYSLAAITSEHARDFLSEAARFQSAVWEHEP